MILVVQLEEEKREQAKYVSLQMFLAIIPITCWSTRFSVVYKSVIWPLDVSCNNQLIDSAGIGVHHIALG